MSSRSATWVYVALLVALALPARADDAKAGAPQDESVPENGPVPGGHVYVGGGLHALFGASGGGAWSLELQVELWRIVVGGSALMASASSQPGWTDSTWVGPRAAYVFTDNPRWAPYAGIGLMYPLRAGLPIPPLCCASLEGHATVPELGVWFYRGRRFGQVALSVRRFVISDLPKGSRFDDFTVVSVVGLL